MGNLIIDANHKLTGVKDIVKLPSGDWSVVPEPAASTPPPEEKPEEKPEDKPVIPEFKWGDTIPTATGMKMLGEDLIFQSPNKSHSARLSSNVKDAIRFQVNPGDRWANDAKNGNGDRERSEIYIKGANLRSGADVWESFWLRIPGKADHKIADNEWCYIHQMHASEDKKTNSSPGDISSAPVLGWQFDGKNQIKVTTASVNKKIHTEKPDAVSRGFLTIERDAWVQFVVRIQFSPTKGLLQIWQDKKLVMDLPNIPIGYLDQTGPYPKFGIYRWVLKNPSSMVIDFAKIELGKTESLRDRIENPLSLEK